MTVFDRYKCLLWGLVVLFPSVAAAQHGDWCACGKHSPEPTLFHIEHPDTEWQDAAIEAFGRWENYADVFEWDLGDGSAGFNGINEIVFFTPATTLAVYGVAISTSTFGVAITTPFTAAGNPPFDACPIPAGTTCGTYSETDIVMNHSFARGWTTAHPNYDDTGPANYVGTAIHELGHALGLSHNFDSLTTMNYYEDFAAIYLSLSDGAAARGHHAGQARTVVDIATFPFRFSGYQYSGTTVASATPTSVAPGATLTLRNFTIENPGSETLSNVRLRVYLSTDSSVSESDHLLGTVSFSTFSTWWDTTGTNFTVPASIPPGAYYIGAIISYNTDQQDAVTYNNSWILDAARRVTVLPPPCTPDVFEPDGSSGQAKPIISGNPKNHSICPVGDNDWSTFTLASESGITLATSGTSGNTRMWLRDAATSEVEFNNNGGTGLFSFVDRLCGVDALPAGTYFVQVDEQGNNDEINDYQLSFTAEPCSPPPCSTDLVLAEQTLSGEQTLQATSSATLGPNLNVDGINIVVNAPVVTILGGTTIRGTFSVGTTPICP